MMDRYRPRRRTPAVWNPFREMEEMERMLDETFGGRPMMRRRLPEEEYVWSPSMEMFEKENMYVIRLELPGVKPEDVDISMSGETLTVKGQRNAPEDIKDEEYQLCETCYGSFTRTVTLPEPVDTENIQANFDNGILDIRIPKAAGEQPKQIKIQSRSNQGQLSMNEPGMQKGETSKMSGQSSKISDVSSGQQTGPTASEDINKTPEEG